jgi:hypothetical protein
MKEIVIRIGVDGKVKVSVSGVKGGSCKDITKSIENALGSAENSEPTEEFYEQLPDDDLDLNC